MSPPASGIQVDDSLWPLLIVRLVGTPTVADLDAYLAKRLECMKRYQPHVLIYDAREARMMSNALIQRHVEWSKMHDALRRETVMASAVVITSPIIRLTASTFLHFLRSKTPYCFAATLPEAVNWLTDWLRKAGYTVQANHARQRFGSGLGWR